MKEKKQWVIYCATNLVNGHQYIGQTNHYNRRIYEHKRAAKLVTKGTKLTSSYCRYFAHALAKYGENNFEWKILATCYTVEEADSLETSYIESLNTLAPHGYNLIKAGNNTENMRAIAMSKKDRHAPNYEARKNWPSKNELEQLLSQHTQKEIGNIFGKTSSGVFHWIEAYNITNRPSSKDRQSTIVGTDICLYCGKEFELKRGAVGKRLFCSKKCKNIHQDRKEGAKPAFRHVRPSKEDLEKLIWEHPIGEVSQILNVNRTSIREWCEKYGIERPSRSYWKKNK